MNWGVYVEFHRLAQQRLPQSDVLSLELGLRSLRWKLWQSRYHKEEATAILSRTFTLPDELRLVEAVGKLLMQAAGADEGREFTVACLQAEAHAVAFAQSLHSASDILAGVLCTSFNLKPGKRQYLITVVDHMEGHQIEAPVAAAARSLLDSPEFLYLRAFVNTVKHISLVDSRYSVGLVPGNESYGLEFRPFSYDSTSWPRKLISDFTGPDFDRMCGIYETIGAELGRAFQQQPAQVIRS